MPFDAASFDTTGVPPREEGAVRAIVLNSPFTPSDRQIIDVLWEEQKTVADYLGDLDGNWLVVLGGREIKPEERDTTTATADDTMVLVRLPKGGNSGILQMILMVALVAFAAWAGPAAAAGLGFVEGGALSATGVLVGKIITGAIIMIGGMLINAMMPQPKPPTRNDTESSRSYGLDGAKATSAEDVPVPVVYGEFRVAGNRVNVYVENSPDGLTQDFYAQYVVSEGPIESITDFEINNQSASIFQNVETAVKLGTTPQSALNWFSQTLVPHNDGRTVTETPLLYNTVTAVDKVRVDLVFPRGLMMVDPQSGDKFPHAVAFTASARNRTTNVVYPIQAYQWLPVSLVPVEGTPGLGRTPLSATRIRVSLRVAYKALTGSAVFDPLTGETTYPALPDSGKYDFTLYVRDADGQVILERTEKGVVEAPTWVSTDAAGDNSGTINTAVPNTRDFVYEVSGDGDPYFQISITNRASTTCDLTYVNDSVELFRLSDNMTVRRTERAPVRVSFSSADMPRGLYEVSIKRNSPQSNSDYVSDEVQISDIYEILTDEVGYARTAHYAIKVRLTDQLNSEPAITAKVKGRKVHIYDATGASTGKVWSNNPADVALDILLSSDWERRFSPSRIDFPGFVRWRAFCAANNLTFNGVFDSLTTVWDAMMTVCRVGRANMVVVGTKWSVILEGPAEPVMMFGDHNIIAGSFSNEWVGRENRANRIEVQFYDKTDRNKRKSVYAVDEAALARNEPIRDTTINLIGVDNKEQAQAEADLQLRINQRIVQACKFRAHLDALGCLPGDVVRVQHSMPAWGWASRVKAVSGDQVTLENPLAPTGVYEQPASGPYNYLPEGNWRILVLRQATQRADATVTQVSGSLLTVNGVHSPEANPTLPNVRRIIVGGQDYRVLNATFLTGQTVFALDRPVTATVGQTAQLWVTEMIQQGTINRPREWDTVVTTVSWPTAWPSAPIQPGDQVMIGRDTLLGKLFRIKSFGYDSNQDRQLELIEYDPWVYEPTGTVPVVDDTVLQGSPLHVVDLTAESYSRATDGSVSLYYARTSWTAPSDDKWGHAGARVYVSRDYGEFALYENVPAGANESVVEARPGETIRFKVIAYATNGTPAPYPTAPISSTLIQANAAPPDVPTGLSGTATPSQVRLKWSSPTSGITPASYVIYHSTASAIFSTATVAGTSTTPFFLINGLNPNTQHWFWVRAVSASGIASTLAGPIAATIPYVGATEIDSRGLSIKDASGNTIFGSDGSIAGSAYINLDGNNVLISTLAANNITPSLTFVGNFATAPTEAQLGTAWRQNAVYKNTIDGKSYVLTGTPLGWVVYLEGGQAFTLTVESTNGTVFRVGQASSTLLKARLFKNGAEVTDETPESWFRWRRVSAIPRPAPNDDATWNAQYASGYRQVSISVDSVYARATFFCDIISP